MFRAQTIVVRQARSRSFDGRFADASRTGKVLSQSDDRMGIMKDGEGSTVGELGDGHKQGIGTYVDRSDTHHSPR
jgi:hypothetical protein